MFLRPDPIDLGDVTLVTVTGVHVDAAQRALQRSMERLRFARTLLISSEPASRPDPRVERIAIPPMSLAGYNRFMVNELHRYIETTHALVVQADGYVINPRRWDPAWLQYDYIGAPWPAAFRYDDGELLVLRNRVGNGGFSLRSRRLLQATASADIASRTDRFAAEDLFICNLLYAPLTASGMRFPAPGEAARFSIETWDVTFNQTLNTAFGFHGRWFEQKLRRSPRHWRF